MKKIIYLVMFLLFGTGVLAASATNAQQFVVLINQEEVINTTFTLGHIVVFAAAVYLIWKKNGKKR